VPTETDRLAAPPADAPLVTTLALRTGLPFVLLEQMSIYGACTSVVATLGDVSPALTTALENQGAQVVETVAVPFLRRTGASPRKEDVRPWLSTTSESFASLQ
jgi:hypothetical protein